MLPVVNQLAKSILNHFIKLLHNTKGQFFGGFILGNEALAIDAVLDRSLVMRGAEFVEESEEKPADLLDITDSFDQVFKHPSLPFFSKQFAARTCGLPSTTNTKQRYASASVVFLCLGMPLALNYPR